MIHPTTHAIKILIAHTQQAAIQVRRYLVYLCSILSFLSSLSKLKCTSFESVHCKDPHYYGWDLSYYDYQGACDQIAIDNPILQLQIRTRPRGWYSTVTEVGFLMKSSGETFNIREDGLGGFTTTDLLTPLSLPASMNYVSANVREITFDLNNFIRINTWYGGISVQVQGTGAFFFGSVGMFGSWNHGGIRFSNGTLYDTSGGYAETRETSFELALDWQVPLAFSLMNAPNETCTAASSCGPDEIFDCGEGGERPQGPARVRRELQIVDPTCTEIDCSNISVELHRLACEEDLILTGDPTWACEPNKVNPVIEEPGPNDFVPHPSDSTTSQGGGGKFHYYNIVYSTLFCINTHLSTNNLTPIH